LHTLAAVHLLLTVTKALMLSLVRWACCCGCK